MRSREVLKRLQDDGWYKVGQDGSHLQLKHAVKPGRVTLPHPRDHIPIGTLKSIERQSGVQMKP